MATGLLRRSAETAGPDRFHRLRSVAGANRRSDGEAR
jgi:hypothetical protein